MSASQVGALIGSILSLMLAPAVWLLVARVISPLRRRPDIANAIAAILVCFGAYASLIGSGSTGFPVIAAILLLCLLFWNYRRDVRGLARREADAFSDYSD